MQILKVLFLLSLSIVFFTGRVFAGPKRFFNGEEKGSKPVLSNEEQTDLNREQVAEEESENEEDGFSAKRPRGESMPCIAETSSQAVAAASSEASLVQGSSSSASSNSVTRTRFLWTQEIPTLYRFALVTLMRLPATHTVFRKGLPPQLWREIIEPYHSSMKEMIQELHKSCQQYSLYRLPPGEKAGELLILFKKELQQEVADRREDLRAKKYPKALFEIYSKSVALPFLRMAVSSLQERESLKKQVALVQREENLEKANLLRSGLQPLVQQSQIAMSLAKETQQLRKLLLLRESSIAEVKSSHQNLMNDKSKLARVASLIEHQRQFLDRSEEFTPVQREKIKTIFDQSLTIFSEELDKRFPDRDEEGMQFLNQKRNACEQMMKVVVSKEPQVQRMQQKIVDGNEGVINLASMILEAKALQHEITKIREGRLTTYKDGSKKAQIESYTPIFNLYEIPYKILNREVFFLQAAKNDLLAGRGELSDSKKYLAKRWKNLAIEAMSNINIASQRGLIETPEEFFKWHLSAMAVIIRGEENQLLNRGALLSIDQEMASLPWDFDKTFEENVAALPPAENL